MPLSRRLTRELKKQREVPEWLKKVDVQDFLERLELDRISPATGKGDINFSCPFSGHTHGDNTPSAFMNNGQLNPDKTTLWQCFSCKRSGNAIGFLAEYENISRTEASELLRQEYAPDFRSPKGGSISAEFEMRQESKREKQKRQKKIQKIPWRVYEQQFWRLTEEAEDYMYSRGFEDETLNEWKIGYDRISSRITIPICDPSGNLVGVKGRSLRNEKPKYKVLGDQEHYRVKRYGFSTYEKSRVVCGVDKIMGEIGTAILSEGELNAMALWQIGYTGISTGSADLSDAQARIIRENFDDVVVLFDSDKAGKRATFGYEDNYGEWKPGVIEKLEKFINVYVVDDHKHDPAKLIEIGHEDTIHELIDNACAASRIVV